MATCPITIASSDLSSRQPLNCWNALFAGNDAVAENWATIASLIETRKLDAVYLRFTTAGEILRPRGFLPTVSRTAEAATRKVLGVLTISLARIHEIYSILRATDAREPEWQRALRYSSDARLDKLVASQA